jgi:hypothetical protein
LEKKIEALEKKISELSMDHHKKPRHWIELIRMASHKWKRGKLSNGGIWNG